MRLKAWLAVLAAVLASVSVAHAQLYWAFTMVDTVELASLKMGYYYVLCPQGTYAVCSARHRCGRFLTENIRRVRTDGSCRRPMPAARPSA
jgi:hypothetical protein